MPTSILCRGTATVFLLVAALAGPSVFAGDPAAPSAPSAAVPASADGRSLVVPEATAAKGAVHHCLPGRQRQINFVSDAPAGPIRGQSNQAVGFAVLARPAAGAPGGAPPVALVAGQWRLPVDSLKTGIPLRDTHLAGENWLDAAKHPHIQFDLDGTENAKEVRRAGAFTTYSLDLVGRMTMHGRTRPMRIPATLVVMPASAQSAKIAKGDLLVLQCKYAVALADFGIGHGDDIGSKVAAAIQLDQTLQMSTVPPSEQPEPAKQPDPKEKP